MARREATDLFIERGSAFRRPRESISSPFRRPLWLLPAPQPLDERRGRPLHRGALELVAGPERIESGWWDGADVPRDYYVARDARGVQALDLS